MGGLTGPLTGALTGVLTGPTSGNAAGIVGLTGVLHNSPLVDSLIPIRGSGSWTFTRATVDTFIDHESIYYPILSGEVAFSGSRRVENLIDTTSASLAVSAANTMTLGAGTYIFSMGAGGGTATFSGTGGATGVLAANASSRTSISKTITAGTLIVTASVAVLVDLQVENVTGQTNQNPASYVSKGVLPAPYHGAGVDGVKYFTTENGNTVASNVVTEATGNPFGMEFLSNTDFADWTAGSPNDWTVSNNDANNYVEEHASGLRIVSDDTSAVRFNQSMQPVAIGTVCRVVITKSNHVDGLIRFTITNSVEYSSIGDIAGSEANGTYELIFTASGTTPKIWIYRDTTPSTDYVINSITITNTLVGVLGRKSSPARTNICLHNQSHDDVVWAATNITVTTDDTPSIIAGNDADLLTSTAGNGTLLQSITSASATRSYQVALKRKTGTGNIDLTVDNGATWTTVAITASWALYDIQQAAVTNPIIGIRIVTSGDAVWVDLDQLENNSFSSNPIITTTTAATINKTELTCQTAGNWPSSGVRHKRLEWTPSGFVSGTKQCLWSTYTDADNYLALFSNGVIIYLEKRVAGVSEYVTFAQVPVVGTTYVIDAFVYADNTLGLYVDGVSASAGFGIELWDNSPDNVQAGWVDNLDGTYTADGSQVSFSFVVQFNAVVVGKIYEVGQTVDSITAGYTRMRSGSSGIGSNKTTVGSFSESIYTLGNTSCIIEASVDYIGTVSGISVKEIYNNSTTLAPIISATMRLGDLNGDYTMYGNIKDVTISRSLAVT